MSRPRLFERLAAPARVIVVSAPPGSGKTVLLRSWVAQPGLAGQAAWVTVGRGERDPQQFWLAVLDALRQTAPGSVLVRPLTAAPDLDGGAIAERLLTDLAPLDDRVWLVIDDVDELGPDALRQLELLVMRAPAGLRFVLAARHDVRLGLHRLRLEGELTEIREPDLRFTVVEAGELLAAAGVAGPETALLVERTEGWAAGLRLAALSLTGHPDPGRFAAEFSGTERTVAEYLLAEVLDRQGEPVRRLLLRTSILERVNGELADLLTGDAGGERALQDLEAAGAFTVSLDSARSWFRYHQMFAGLLRLELRRTEPGEMAALHSVAAGWFAGHGFGVEAVRHAQAARDWELAARLLTDLWPGLYLEGRAPTVHELLAGFPAESRAADAELAVVAAADELAQGSLEGAEQYLTLAGQNSAPVPNGRRDYRRLLVWVVRLLLDRQRGNLPAVAADARELRAMAEVAEAARPGLGTDLGALALIGLGSTAFWANASVSADAERYLDRGIALARRGGRPYLEFTGLAYQAPHDFYRSFTRAAKRGRQAVELAEQHGWADDPAVSIASMAVGVVLTWQGQPDEAEPWLQRAERGLSAETHPVAVLGMRHLRGTLELERGRNAAALAALEAGELLGRRIAGPPYLVARTRAMLVHSLVRLGQAERGEQFLAGLSEQDRGRGELFVAAAGLRLAQGDPRGALAALAPIQEDPVADDYWGFWQARTDLLEAIALDTLGDPDAAHAALERALDLSERSGDRTLYLLYPAADLLERHARHRTAHAAMVAEIRGLLAGTGARPPDGGPSPSRSEPLLEPLSASEIRVLRYLPTNLTGPEIAAELYVSVNTVRTHLRHLYAKLGTHSRTKAVARARGLGLLAPSPHR